MTTVGGSGGASVTMRVTVEFEKGTIMNAKTEVNRGGMSFDIRAGAIGAETRRLSR